jgi:amino acid adenylation domain-containing protein/FkbH-like protein
VSRGVREDQAITTSRATPANGTSPDKISAVQAAVAQVWAEVLQIEDVDAATNFFDLGGDSLKAIEVISRLQALLKIELPLIAFFEEPTIAHLTAVAEQLHQEQIATTVPSAEAAVAQVWAEVLQVQADDLEVTKNFFDLGGDSLKAIEVISRLQALLDIELPLIAFFEEPTIAHLAAVAEQLRQQQPDTTAPSSAADQAQPLSFSQLTFWLLQQRDPVGYLYNEPRVLRIRGNLRADVLERSLNEIWRRHDVLRARLQPGAEEPTQVVEPTSRVEVAFDDLSSVASTHKDVAALKIASNDWKRPFDLASESPIRVRLVRLHEDDHLLIIVMHHVVSDGHSDAIFFDELSTLYNSILAEHGDSLPALDLQYPQYAASERAQMQAARLESEIEYWRSQLEGAPATLSLPTDHPILQKPGHSGDAVSLLVPHVTVEKLKAAAQANGSTFFTLLLAALRILLYRWTGQQEIVIGTVASNRTRSGTDRMIGCFLNFLPLRNKVDGHELALGLLGREKQVVMDAFAHQECPFLKIAAAVAPSRASETNPIYNVALLLQNFPKMKFTADPLQAEFVDLEVETALLDVRFVAAEQAEGLRVDCEYKTDLFERTTMQNLLEGLLGVLETLTLDPARQVADFPIPQQLVQQSQAARLRDRKQTVAIASTFTAEPLQGPFAFWMKQLGINAEITFAPYNQVFQQLLDPSSLISRNADGVNVVLLRLTDWKRVDGAANGQEARHNIEKNVRDFAAALQTAAQQSVVPTIICLCPAEENLLSDSEWAKFVASTEETLVSEFSASPGVHVITSAEVLERYPVADYQDEYAEREGKIPYTPAFFIALATMLARRVFSLHRSPRKVVVVDCDNTLWKGVCGEEGSAGVCVDAPRRALQEFLLRQIDAGMLLCLCSKNAEEDVEAVFAENSGMVLKEEHVAARRVNWNSKSQNLRELADDLHLGLDSFVFIDDNPIECAEVQEQCPEVLTLTLPQDDQLIPGFLDSVWALDHWKATAEDAKRTEMYRQSVGRDELRKRAATLDEFLAGLELKLEIHAMQDSELARVSQLTERTNQFNFTTIRRRESEVRQYLQSGGECLVVRLSDRFGDYGLIGVMLYSIQNSALNIDTVLLSCRALGRKVEHQMLSRLGEIAEQRSLTRVVAKVIPTQKNQPALDFLNNIGRQFRQGMNGYYVYEFPANYLATLLTQQLSGDSQLQAPAKMRSMPQTAIPGIVSENRVVAWIAAHLRDVPSISRAIHQQRATQRRDGVFVAPRNPIEEMVAAIWAELLDVNRVGIHDDFFVLGGHSLLATQVVARVRRTLGVELPLRAMFEAPMLAEFARRIELARQDGRVPQAPPITRVESRDQLPLSFAQQRLWFLDQLEPGNALYNMPQVFRVRGELDSDALHRALNKIVERHESLRTSFVLQNNKPVQSIAPSSQIPVLTTDLSGLSEPQREDRVQQLAYEEARRPFNLSSGPVMRAQLLRLASDDHVLLLTMHHIASDRWSMGLVAEELAVHYSAFSQGKPSPLPGLAIQYADFAVWQRKWLQGEVLDAQLEFWKKQLAGAPQVLELPTDRPRPPQMSMRGEMQSMLLPRKLVDAVSALSRDEGVTPFMLLLSVFEVLMSRYSGQEDIIVGSPIANRSFAELEPLIGFFVNTLALRGDLSGDPSFRELLGRVREVCLRAYAHQDIPFEKLVEELQPERSLSHSPIFQVMFALQNAPLQALELPRLKLERIPVHTGTSMFDMSWFAIEVPEGLLLRVEYSSDLFDTGTITRALGHFEKLLESTIANPDQRISCLTMLGEDERRKVLLEFNATQADFPEGLCIHNLLERTADRSPEATALICGNQRTTYSELNKRANQVAQYLIRLGAKPDSLVAVFMERVPDLVPAIFGVLKSGAAYVPLDATYPRDRLRAILADSGAPIVLTHESLRGQLEDTGATLVYIDSDSPKIDQESTRAPETQVTLENLAYVLFTSGSTGRPKGVALEHHNAVTFVQWAQTIFTPQELAGVLFGTSIGFDMSTFEMFITAAAGGKIIMAENPLYLPTLPARDEVTLINTVPSAIAELVRMNALPDSLTTVALAGEALPDSLVEDIYRIGTVSKVYNLYGPTESGYSTWTLVRRGAPVTIGKPIAKEECYILDKNLNPLPIGVPGELYLAGGGLARGYFGRPDLTAERFVTNPFSTRPARMYKTGDLCRWLPTGDIEYLGRMDHQIKLRGFRIEPAEIEAALAKHPDVRQCLVLAREDEPGLKRLVAYVVTRNSEPVSEDTLSNHLRQSLPDYMVPSAFVLLQEFPLTPNGKIDRKALPAPERQHESLDQYVAPRDAVEARLAAIWAEVLHVHPVSATADFFALGGHSLLAAQVISRLRRDFDMQLPLKAIFECPTLEVLAARIQAAKHGFEIPPLIRVSRERPIPASFAQQRLWFLDQLEPDNPVYNIPYTLEITGSLDAAALETSLARIAERQESLRTSFRTEAGEPVQVIHDSVQIPFRKIDLSTLDSGLRETEARRIIAEDANRSFDLTRAPLLRATLLRLSKNKHYLLINIHHIVSDRWSLGVLSQELASLYEATMKAAVPQIPALPLQYADYTVWQRDWLRGEALNQQLEYWKEQLKDVPPLLELPTDRPRQATESFRGDVAYLSLPRELSDKLNHLSHKQGTTLFMTLLAGFQVLLSRYSGQDDVVVGTAIANRTNPDLENVIGFFLNTLPLRTRLEGDPSFSEILVRTKETALGAYAHQDVPFEKLVEELNPERNLSHSPLVQVFFVLQNAPMEGLRLPGLDLKHVPSGIKTVKGDMYLSMVETPAGLEGRLEYSTDLFDHSTAERMLDQFRVLLEAAVANPTLTLSQLPLLSVAERKRMLVDWNATQTAFPLDLSLIQHFEQQVERTPLSVAVVADDQRLSYDELNRRANQLAHRLKKMGVGPDTLVGVCMERSVEMVVALYGVLKSGGAYVPIDPEYPHQRVEFMLRDAGVPVLLIQERLLKTLPAHKGDLVCPDRDWSSIAVEDVSNPAGKISPDNLAYMIYTSGSTGQPKGALNTNRGICNRLLWMQQQYGLTASDKVLQKTPFSFDVSVWEFFWPLMCGAQLVIATPGGHRDPNYLARLIQEEGITVTHFVPSMLRIFLEEPAAKQCGSLRHVICSGEALPFDLQQQFFESSSAQLHNLYGPTEAAVDVTHWTCRTDYTRPVVPIGRPVANTQVYVLDRWLQPTPIGVPGELYLGGIQVGRGYHNKPELTAERFIKDPFSNTPGARLYKTGDLCRWLADGVVEYLGRLDFQIKIRGLRVELGEIEALLSQHKSVQHCVVLAREDVPGEKRLVAYIIANPGEPVSSDNLRQHLKQSVPEYMIPAAFVSLNKLPLSPNGKVDRKALPPPERGTDEGTTSKIAPRNPIEEVVAGIWSEVLQCQQLGVHQDFFELGGHSLLATQVVSRVRQAFRIELPLRVLFEAPTIASLAQRVASLAKQQSGIEIPPMRRADRTKRIPLSFAQQRLWFLDQLEPLNPLYNISYVTRMSGQLDIDALEESLRAVVRRHESLRTTFQVMDDEPVQVITPDLPVKIILLDVSHLPTLEEREAEARRLANEEIRTPFNLELGPLIRPLLIKIGEDDHAMILNMHHIISDRWSFGVLSQELATLYEARIAGKESPLPELEIQYVDYAVWQREFLSGDVLDRQLGYWRQKLEGAPAVLELPTDRPRKGVQQFFGALYRHPFPPELIRAARALSRRQRGTFFMTLLASFQLLLARITGQSDLVVGTDLANRNQLETEKLIGFFVNLLPIRARIDTQASFTDFFQQVRESSLEAMTHQDIPFDKLVEELRPERNLTHNPLVQILFVMQNTPQAFREFGGLKFRPLGVSGSSRFDLVVFIDNPESNASTTWVYNPKLFDTSTIARMANTYESLLKRVCAEPDITLSSVFAAIDVEEKELRAEEQKKLQQTGLEKLKKVRRKAMEGI